MRLRRRFQSFKNSDLRTTGRAALLAEHFTSCCCSRRQCSTCWSNVTESEKHDVRQQVKWVVWGTLLAVTPFVFLYALVYLFGAPTDRWLTDVAILPLALIPFAFGYSVLRYRLMDVELVVRRVFVYAFTTLAIALLIGVVVYLGGLYAFGSDQRFNSGEITLRVVLAVLAMAAIVMVAAPVKNFLQEQVDRLFYGERYDLQKWSARFWSHAFRDHCARTTA